MIVGCYTLDLYCDDPEHARPIGMLIGAPFQYTGRTRTGCVQEAKADGWKLQDRADRAICPACARRRRHKRQNPGW